MPAATQGPSDGPDRPRPRGRIRPEHGFGTRTVHLGIDPDPVTGAISPAIVQTSTFVQDGTQRPKPAGYEYSRSANPTRDLLQRHLAGLELGGFGFAFPSGLSAADAVIRLAVGAGGTVIIGTDAYGGTYRLLEQVWGHSVRMVAVDHADLSAVRQALAEADGPRLLWVESPTNPLMRVVDVAALAEAGRTAGALVVVDNTFATPFLQQPLTLGADIVLHSTTKYLSGHSDTVGGGVVLNDPELAERAGFLQNAAGAVSGPFDAWLTIRGMKTLALRMERHCHNAQRIAEFLQGHPRVSRVHYPGLPDHPQHELASRQMRGFGGMVSLHLAGGAQAARAFAEAAEVFLLAESLGGVESLIEHPGDMTHLAVKGTPREVAGDLVRLSVGIEDVDDLIADLAQALDRI